MLSLEETLTILTNAQLPLCAAFVQDQAAELEWMKSYHSEAFEELRAERDAALALATRLAAALESREVMIEKLRRGELVLPDEIGPHALAEAAKLIK